MTNCDLNTKNIHSILMSSDYLDMPKLTNLCIEFIVDNIQEILSQKEQIPSYKSHIAKNIARKFCEKKYNCVLDNLVDEKDVILSRLYKKKLELYFENSRNLLFKCIQCNELFTEAQKEVFNCSLNKHKFIGPHGEVKAYHQVDLTWDLNDYVMQYREFKMPWKEIYWKMWARTKIFKCRNCCKYFKPIDTKNTCRYHSKGIKMRICDNSGVYECCNTKVMKFNIGITVNLNSGSESQLLSTCNDENDKIISSNGCCTCDHVVDTEDADYLSPEINSNEFTIKQNIACLYREDLDHYWRNIEIILKDSKMPEIKPTQKSSNLEFDDYVEDEDEPFSERKSRYIKEKSSMYNFEEEKNILNDKTTIQAKVQTQKPSDKLKVNIWRKDALRYDDRDCMKELMENLKQKRDMQKKL